MFYAPVVEDPSWVTQIIQVILLIILLGFGTKKGTDVVKAITSLFPDWKWAQKLVLTGARSMIFAAALITFVIFKFDVNPLTQIEALGFEILDPELAKSLMSLLVLFGANYIHDNTKKNPLS